MNKAQAIAFQKWKRKGFTNDQKEPSGAITIKRERRDLSGRSSGRYDFKQIAVNGQVENVYKRR